MVGAVALATAWLLAMATLAVGTAAAAGTTAKADPLAHGRLPHRMKVTFTATRSYEIAQADHAGSAPRTIFTEKVASATSRVVTRTAFAEMQLPGKGSVLATSTPGAGLSGCGFDYDLSSVRAGLQVELTPAGAKRVRLGVSWRPDADVRSIVSPIARAACDGLVPTGAGSVAQEGPRLSSGGCAGRYAMCTTIKRSALERRSFYVALSEDSTSGGSTLPQSWVGSVRLTFRRG
jgi:hypothetical protein